MDTRKKFHLLIERIRANYKMPVTERAAATGESYCKRNQEKKKGKSCKFE